MARSSGAPILNTNRFRMPMNSIVISLTTRNHLGRTDRLFFLRNSSLPAHQSTRLDASPLWFLTQQHALKLGPALSPPPALTYTLCRRPLLTHCLTNQPAGRLRRGFLPPLLALERRVPKQRHLARHRPLDSVLPIRSPVIHLSPP